MILVRHVLLQGITFSWLTMEEVMTKMILSTRFERRLKAWRIRLLLLMLL
ncbi:hypothetical protein [Lacrimispora celerecrescens]|nr:hypothetical protein [Lacrimispora celerecrescens]